MLRRVYLRSFGFTLPLLGLPLLGLVIFCLIGLHSTWAQGSGSQPAKTTTASVASPSASAQQPVAMVGAADDDKSYRISPGDLLEIKILNRPELAREARVSNQGRISLAMIEEVSAACLTEKQLAQLIADKYKVKYLRDPQVSVFIREYSIRPVAVMGAVAKPGQFQLQRRVRLLELLTHAGGMTATAGRKIFLIQSGEPNFCQAAESPTKPDAEAVPILKTFERDDVLKGGPEAFLYVEPGDIVTVPEANQIFVTGNVIKPGSFLLQNRTTLTEAINMASGFAQDAAKKRISLSRQDPVTGARKDTIYSYEDIKARRAEDVVLQANDIIEVPNSAGSSFKRGLINALTQSAGLLPTYGIIR